MVRVRELSKKPLVEAILELKWRVDPNIGDPSYSIFLGRLYDLLRKKYPYHQPLPASVIPEQMAGNIAQHRFRVAENKWPLVQVGPGLVTVNDTDSYTWEDFVIRANEVVKSTFKAYPNSDELKLTSLVLRYIDSDNFDYLNNNVFVYLKDKLKVNLVIPQQLFDSANVKELPKGFSFRVSYPAQKPKGTVILKFATGVRRKKESIVWETAVQSMNEELPSLPRGFKGWAASAHAITDDWFFKLIEGELERKFAGES